MQDPLNNFTVRGRIFIQFQSQKLCNFLVMDDSEISILDSMRFDFWNKISISNYKQFLPSVSRLVHLAQSVAAAIINVANLV